jgi:positive regulator of sigma E activity
LETIGLVIKVDGILATVFIEKAQSCDSCEFSKFCSTDKKGREIICRNPIGAKEGDVVQLETSNISVLAATVFNFVLPLFFLIGGITIGMKIWRTELGGFFSGISLMVFYFIVFLFIDKKILKGSTLLPEITQIKKTN